MTNSTKYDHRQGYVVYPDNSCGAAGQKAPFIDYGTDIIKPERY